MRVLVLRDALKVFRDRRRGEVRALDGMNLEVAPGEIVALLGPNGAGKTTAMRVLVGLLSLDGGSAEVDGMRPRKAKHLVGYLPTEAGHYERLTPREVLRIFGSLRDIGGRELAERIEDLAQRLEMTEYMDTRIAKLSTGQKQRVAVARVMVGSPRYYLLDEPTRGLDPLGSRVVMELIREAQREGAGVLLSTHITEEAEYLAGRVVVVNRGRVAAQGTMDELRELTGRSKLREVFLSLVGGGNAGP